MCHPVMHDSDSGIGIDSGMTPFFAGIGIGIGIKKTKFCWNRNRNRNQAFYPWNRNRNQGFWLTIIGSLPRFTVILGGGKLGRFHVGQLGRYLKCIT